MSFTEIFCSPVKYYFRDSKTDTNFEPASSKAKSDSNPYDSNANIADKASNSIRNSINSNIKIVSKLQLILLTKFLKRSN